MAACACTPLPKPERSRRLLRAHARMTLWHQGLGLLLNTLGATRAVRSRVDQRLDHWALTALTGEPCPTFGLPVPYARLAYAPALRLELPAASLHMRLADWVRCSDRVLHTSRHFVSACDWTPLLTPFALSGVMREASELMAASLDYKRTRIYEHYRRRIATGRTLRRHQTTLDSTARLDAYFERFVALFRSIQAHGVLPRHQAASLPGTLSRPTAIRGWRSAWGEQDIGVAIDAQGRPVALPGGKHRLAIATVLALPTVPVEVRLVHAHWLAQLRHGRSDGWARSLASGLLDVRNRAMPRGA